MTAAPGRRTGRSDEAASPDALPRAIGRPATNALAVIGVTTLSGVTRFSEKELLAMHGIGPKAVAVLRDALAAAGLRFRNDRSPTPP